MQHNAIEWAGLADLETVNQCSIPFGIDKDNYIFIVRPHNQSQTAIHKFSIDTNEWSKIHQFEDFDGTRIPRTVLNVKNQSIYLVYRNQIIKQINLNNDTIMTQHTQNEINTLQFDADSKCIFLNDALHFIGGYRNNSISKWDSNKNALTKVTDMYRREKLYDFGLVHDKKHNSLLLFGGYYGGFHDSILEFDISANKWHKLSVTLPKKMHSIHCLMAMNNKYVLLFGGSDETYEFSDDIFIFCIKNKTLRQSNIKCPLKSTFSGVTVSDKEKDKKAVFGYVRKEWKLCEISDHCFPPNYLLELMHSYYFNEYVYLWDMLYKKHYKMSTFDILFN